MPKPSLSIKEKLAAKLAEKSSVTEEIKVHLPKEGVWRVDIFIPFEVMSQDKMTSILRQAKMKISARDKIPVGLLSYEDLMDKEVLADGYRISARIIRTEAEVGDPELHIMKASSPDGVEYDDMILLLNVFPKKKGGDEVKMKDITEKIAETSISAENINYKLLDEAVMKVRQDMVAVRNLMLLQGRFPDPSEDAFIQYFTNFREIDAGSLIGSEIVEPDQIILRKSPARAGEKDGFSIRGKVLKPRVPHDIELIAGEGSRISADNTEVFTVMKGLTRIREIPTEADSSLMRMAVSIEPIEVVEGGRKINITTENHLEIKGGLKSGSRVISRGEVFVQGDVEEGTSVSASGNIEVTGEIKGGNLVSEKNIESAGDVTGSQLLAHGKLTIKGIAKNSLLRGMEVNSAHVIGCEIVVGSKSVIDTVSADEKGFTAKITAGMSGHLQEKVDENQKFIDYANRNLKRFQDIVGEEIVNEATPANVSRMTINYCRNFKSKGIKSIPKDKIDAVKTLIGAIGPIRDTMNEKSKSIKMFLRQIEQGLQSNPELTIFHHQEGPLEVDIDGVKGTVEAGQEPVVIRQNGGIFMVEPVKEPLLGEES